MSNEWMTVERNKFRKPTQEGDGTKELVKEILASLVADQSYKHNPRTR